MLADKRRRLASRGSRDARAHALATRFAIGFAISAALWLVSLWVAVPLRDVGTVDRNRHPIAGR